MDSQGKPQLDPPPTKLFQFFGSTWSTLKTPFVRAWPILKTPFVRAWQLRKPSLSGIFVASFGSTAMAIIWNETEIYRMSRAVERGLYFSPAVKEDKIDDRLLPVDVDLVSRKLLEPEFNGFVGLVGVKGTGKSVFLDKLGYKLSSEKSSHVVKFKKTMAGAINDDIYYRLREEIFIPPAFWGWVRIRSFTPEKAIIKVFRRVQEKTGLPVTVLIDISPRKSVESIEAEVPLPQLFGTTKGHLKIDPSTIFPVLNVENFVKDVKSLATDEKVMHCAFVASDGLLFQLQSYREARLKMFLTRELTIEQAKLQLAKKNLKMVNEYHLRRIPRTFVTLEDYAYANDKDEYVEGSFRQIRAKIKPLGDPYKNLLRKAAKQPFDYTDITENLTNQDILNVLVANNLLVLNQVSLYELQFGVIAEAIKEFK